MKRGLTGHYVPLPSAAGENARAFVPNPLPPSPPLELNTELHELIEKAMLALGPASGATCSSSCRPPLRRSCGGMFSTRRRACHCHCRRHSSASGWCPSFITSRPCCWVGWVSRFCLRSFLDAAPTARQMRVLGT